jgi:hypothetical protein
MHSVILITGKVEFQINLDPTVWIFDERKFPLEERLPGVEGLAMELGIFINHAQPHPEATKVICHRSQGEPITLSLEQVRTAYLCFAKENRPIREGGPALLYLADGSNKDHPIDFLTQLEIV